MQRRLFVGINLNNPLKRKLAKKIEQWQDLPVKWSREENFHLTLLFLGYVDDEKLMGYCQKLSAAIKKSNPLFLEMKSIELAPDAKKPKMVWYTGEVSPELKSLTEKIEKALDFFVVRKKSFSPHITLGRLRAEKWKKLSEPININEPLDAVIPVTEIVLFESFLENGRRIYEIIETFPLES
jgi:RNA 2',3'-cyclic 3'-phosphodiesterase